MTGVSVHDRLAADLDGTVAELLAHDGPVLDRQTGTWFVARYAQVRALLVDRRLTGRSSEHATSDLTGPQRASVAPLEDHFQRWLGFSDAPALEPLRALFRRAVAAFAADFRLDELAMRVRPRHLSGVDLVSGFADQFTVLSVSTMLALPENAVSDGTNLLAYLGLDRYEDTVVTGAKQALTRLRDRFAGDYLAHAVGPLPDAFRHALADGADPADVFAVFTQVLTGGLEPTKAVLVDGLARCCDPLQLKQFDSDPAGYADELTRLVSPFHFAPRTVAADIDVSGTTLPAGSRVMLVLSAANRDPARFPRPHEIDLTRPRRQHLAFGWGRHICLGARLAELVVTAGIGVITRHREWPVSGSPRRRDIRTGGMTRAGELVFIESHHGIHG